MRSHLQANRNMHRGTYKPLHRTAPRKVSESASPCTFYAFLHSSELVLCVQDVSSDSFSSVCDCMLFYTSFHLNPAIFTCAVRTYISLLPTAQLCPSIPLHSIYLTPLLISSFHLCSHLAKQFLHLTFSDHNVLCNPL